MKPTTTIDRNRTIVPIALMQPFATEFPVKRSTNKAEFPAEVFGWLTGMQNSEVLTSTSAHELDGENVHLIAKSGEELRMRELNDAGDWVAVGFQHDMPDDQGRIWRTEAVLRHGKTEVDQDFIRLKTQCLAKHSGAILASPKKPYLVKSLLKEGLGGIDGKINVQDTPIWLHENDEDIILAENILSGVATKSLPVVYISAIGSGKWLLKREGIKNLAYQLGGVAHVVVEPNRVFSIRLMDASGGRNIYNGTVGIATPGEGFIRRFFIGREFKDTVELVESVQISAVRLRGYMPSVGWDWTELQEHSLRHQRTALRGSLSQGDADQLLEDFSRELSALQGENRRLTEQLNSQTIIDIAKEGRNTGTDDILHGMSKEIYPGECSDRIRLAVQTALSFSETNGTDARTISVWKRIVQCVTPSPALKELLDDLKRTTKDPNRVADQLTTLLQRHGYRSKSDNKHIRLEPLEGYDGLQNITIPKTPSDRRGLANLRSQVERTLGISKLM